MDVDLHSPRIQKGVKAMKYDLKDKHVMIEHSKTGEKVQIKIGYSWTVFFFGSFVFLFRLDWVAFIISTLILTALYQIFPALYHSSYYPVSLMWALYAFFYNGSYLKRALKGNWVPADATSRNRLYEKGYVKTHCYELEPKEEN
jgi:hypothetical protein